MFSSFFGSFSRNRKWYLVPKKHPKGSPHHFSSKVLLPYSLLRELAQLNFQPPYVFEICHENGALRTACSVLDFALENDEVHVPEWMYEQISLSDSPEVTLSYIVLERGEGIRLLPHSVDFLEVENPKSELEKGLRDYHVVSYGDEILLNFEEVGNIRFTIAEIFPENCESIYLVDTDLKVDFEEPLGYRQKLEDEKTVLKYVEIGDEDRETKSLRIKRVGMFLDWDNLYQGK
ncbi:ubiquitin fusion degradation protein 1 [Pancytospora epiphaga]|nr:ubiquitin fusion degradation protein 1 [Pancytospora epiphaga]